MINVFYDDRCPLCRREIEYYKKQTPDTAIKWLGISQNVNILEKYNISYIDSLKILHAINADKEIKNNQDKHRAELEKLEATIKHNESEIRYKDDIIRDSKQKIEEKSRKIDELVRINDKKDEEVIKLHERLLECKSNK